MLQTLQIVPIRCSLLCALLLGACSGGGGGAAPTFAASATPVPPATPAAPLAPAATGVSGTDTGVAGSVSAPGAAIYSSALPSQMAAVGGPTFATLTNTSFPLISSSWQASATGFTAASGGGGTATVTTAANSTEMQLVIPAVNVNTTLTYRQNVARNLDAPTFGLSYVVMGEWGTRAQPNGSGPLQNFTGFVFGFETAPAAMPVSGTAALSGFAWAQVIAPSATNLQTSYVDGKAQVSVDFASGKVTGTLSQMQDYSTGLTLAPWNDVTLNASLAAGTNRFSGTTAAASAPRGAFSLSSSATGRLDGAFYGPAAQNAGAVWSLSDGSKAALGSLVAGTPP